MVIPIDDSYASSDRAELEQHRARVLDALSRHSDPVLREIGEQLSNGVVSPHDLLRQPAYVEVLRRGLEQLDADTDAVRSRLFDSRSETATHGREGGTRTGTR